MRARHEERRRAKKGEGEEGDKTATNWMEKEGTQYKSNKRMGGKIKALLLFKTTFYDECIQPQRKTHKELKQKRLNIFLLLSLTEKNKGSFPFALFTVLLPHCDAVHPLCSSCDLLSTLFLCSFVVVDSLCLTKPFSGLLPGFLHFQLPVFPTNKMYLFGPAK